MVSSYTCANQYSATVFKFLSLTSFLLFTTLSGELSVAFCSSWCPSNSFSSTHEVCWTLPGFFLYYYPGTFLRQWSGAIIGLILLVSCPLGIFVLHSLMPVVLKIVSCICPLLQMGGKSFPVTLSCPDVWYFADVFYIFAVIVNVLCNFVFLYCWL